MLTAVSWWTGTLVGPDLHKVYPSIAVLPWVSWVSDAPSPFRWMSRRSWGTVSVEQIVEEMESITVGEIASVKFNSQCNKLSVINFAGLNCAAEVPLKIPHSKPWALLSNYILAAHTAVSINNISFAANSGLIDLILKGCLRPHAKSIWFVIRTWNGHQRKAYRQRNLMIYRVYSIVQNGYLFVNADCRRLSCTSRSTKGISVEDALTTDLDADEDVPENNCDGTQELTQWELLISSGISLGCTSVHLPVTIVEELKGLVQYWYGCPSGTLS